MVVDESVVVEAKATEILHPNAPRQLFAYLRATNLEIGLLLHFGPRPRFHRIVCLNDSKPGLRTHSVRLITAHAPCHATSRRSAHFRTGMSAWSVPSVSSGPDPRS